MSDESTSTSRSEFLKRTAGATGLVVGAGVWARSARAASQADPPPDPEADPTAAAAAGSRAFVAGHFYLELEGTNAGLLKSFAGGSTTADVINEQAGASYFSRKHIGNPKYEDFTVQCGLTMDKSLNDWIANTWTGSHPRHDGAIIATDFGNNAKSRRSFADALISEVTIPAMDGSSKEAAYLTVKFTSEFSRTTPAAGKVTLPGAKAKQWLASNFKLEIDGGIDTSRVAKIDAFTIKQQIITDQIGETRDPVKVPGKLEFPNLKVTIADQGSDSWFQWFDDFVIQGNNSNADERSGRLRFLTPNLKDELGQVRFFNLGIFRIGAEPTDAGAIKRLIVDLYCERMELGVGPPPAPD